MQLLKSFTNNLPQETVKNPAKNTKQTQEYILINEQLMQNSFVVYHMRVLHLLIKYGGIYVPCPLFDCENLVLKQQTVLLVRSLPFKHQ